MKIPDGSENSIGPVDDVPDNISTRDTDESAHVRKYSAHKVLVCIYGTRWPFLGPKTVKIFFHVILTPDLYTLMKKNYKFMKKEVNPVYISRPGNDDGRREKRRTTRAFRWGLLGDGAHK